MKPVSDHQFQAKRNLWEILIESDKKKYQCKIIRDSSWLWVVSSQDLLVDDKTVERKGTDMRKITKASKETEREREKGYKGEMNGKVLVKIAVDAKVKNRNVSIVNQWRILISWKKFKQKSC